MLALRPVNIDANGASSHTLVVGYPVAAGQIDTARVALKQPNGTIDYFAKTRWVDFLPVIVQTTLTESLSLSGVYKIVRSDEAGLGDDRILKSNIRHFEAVYPAYMDRPPEVIVEIAFTISDVETENVIDTFTLRSAHQSVDNTTTAIHDAFVKSYADVQEQLIGRL